MFHKILRTYPLPFWLLFTLNFMIMMVANLQGILPSHLNGLGASDTLVAVFFHLPNVCVILLVVFSAHLPIFRKRVPLVRIGFLLAMIAAIGSFLGIHSLWALLFFRLLFGMAYALEFALLFGMMYEWVSPGRRRTGAAIFGISGLLTGALGSMPSQYFFEIQQMSSLYLLIFITSLTGAVLSLSVTKTPEGRATEKQEPPRRPALPWLPFFLALAFGGAFGGLWTFVSRMSQFRLGHAEISSFFVAFTMVSVTSRVTIGLILDKIPRKLILLVAFSFAFGAYFLFSRYQSNLELLVMGVMYGITHSLLFPTLSATFVDWFPEGKQWSTNLYLGVFTSGQIFFSLIMGQISDHFGLGKIPFIMMGVFALALALILFQGHKLPKAPLEVLKDEPKSSSLLPETE